ncbi:dicarboxylate/amino acid:cation symporter [Endozoicomonas sp. SCSIO W0465]|uniref:dicarboxylate/amino acid:cation symporter n=1 Tax=Endozoicomonas sp. SCSIO W0465 TaxID=2918516 RepID=UPI002074B941|nr:dicarboxylate/amino acid:cation symporter [Endozoicomonas sp. SCSIO W0465]USE39598.1 dicarboxylate/amino acid:cation symporter [Endozoicomonas sp. SCSIO W0465]
MILLIAGLYGVVTGWLDLSVFNQASEVVSDLFIRMLKLMSLPIIFFALVSTLSGMVEASEVKRLGGQVLKYTVITTLIAATVALALYLLIAPAGNLNPLAATVEPAGPAGSYWSYLIGVIPASFVEPFYTHNVMGVLFLALLLSAAIMTLERSQKEILHSFFDSMFAAIMKMTGLILQLMPLAVWAFVNQFIHDLQSQKILQDLALYLLCVLLANIVQAGLILPILLKFKGISPWQTIKAMWPALTVAFFAKSSAAALPYAVECAEKDMNIQGKVARFSLPLCITVNMNACAAFILITVLFVSQSNGIMFSPLELLSWIAIASIAAIGNAGVPMGCYMLSSAFLSAMGVPLQLLVIILPFYALIDMFESAINVWSDSCVTAMVNADLLTDRDLGKGESDEATRMDHN